MQGVRHKYVDIMTDSLHASSSDRITSNALAMLSYRMHDHLRRKWTIVAGMSMKIWERKGLAPPFRQDSRQGFACAPPALYLQWRMLQSRDVPSPQVGFLLR